MAQHRVMVVDDDAAMCEFLRSFLGTLGYGTLTATNGEEAVRCFQAESPDAVLLDIVMPGMNGLAALAEFKHIDPDVPVIVVSGQGQADTIVRAMKLGASDFLSKPFNDVDLEVLLGNALKQRQLHREVDTLREELTTRSQYMALFGNSDAMQGVRDLIVCIADTDVAVLILGESGTGKELVARAVHEQSPRHDKPFVKVNCAALPTELLESELFGFEKGAFTDATKRKAGKFEFTNHGTIFLDEIGDMHPSLQAKLLQVLQDGEFSPLGGTADVRVDVRVITATNRDLKRAVAEGRFREDLYFRLNVVPIRLSPLRERREEIPFLVDHFLKKYAAEYHKPATPVSAPVMRQFMEHAWPGNIRQLENMIKRMVVLGSEASILTELQQPATSGPDRLPSPSTASTASVPPGNAESTPATVAPAANTPQEGTATDPGGQVPASGHVSLKDVSRTAAREAERELMLRALTRTHWNRKEAAQLLEISYKALLYKIKECGLDKAS